MYFQKWEAMDKKYHLMDKWQTLQVLGKENYQKARRFEKKHEIGTRVGGFLVLAIDSTIRGVTTTATKLSNSKDRQEMIRKLPVS